MAWTPTSASPAPSMFDILLARLATALDAADVPYMVIGGQAVLFHGDPRLTRDIDITVGIAPERLDTALRVADAAGITPLVDPEPFVAETYVLPCEDAESGIRVDMVFSNEGYEREAMTRTVTAVVGGAEVRFASVEDLLIQKLVAGRPRDVEDAQGVLNRHPSADLGLVRHWLSAFDAALGTGTVATLDRLQDQA